MDTIPCSSITELHKYRKCRLSLHLLAAKTLTAVLILYLLKVLLFIIISRYIKLGNS